MAQEKKGLIARMLEGKEKSEEYARSTLPTNRWQLFWDIFKGNFGKIFKVNLLILIFFIPIIAIFIFRFVMDQSNGITYPFGSNLTVGYPAQPSIVGFSEMLLMQTDAIMYGAIAVASFIAAVGLSGGMYVIRNMVWTEGIFVANDFWRGVKLNFWNALQAALFFSLIMLLCKSLINMTELSIATQSLSKGQRVWFRISEAFSGIIMALAAMMSLWMIALGVNYKQGVWTLIKNSFLMTIGMLPQSLFFGVLALLPFGLFLIGGGIFTLIAGMLLILFAFAYATNSSIPISKERKSAEEFTIKTGQAPWWVEKAKRLFNINVLFWPPENPNWFPARSNRSMTRCRYTNFRSPSRGRTYNALERANKILQRIPKPTSRSIRTTRDT